MARWLTHFRWFTDQQGGDAETCSSTSTRNHDSSWWSGKKNNPAWQLKNGNSTREEEEEVDQQEKETVAGLVLMSVLLYREGEGVREISRKEAEKKGIL